MLRRLYGWRRSRAARFPRLSRFVSRDALLVLPEMRLQAPVRGRTLRQAHKL